ncbi:vps68p [Saccharomyces arboricola H-6]|uniref:Vps68p n=1 Tax=Saccharomyces arboricola (strain H-6 / AS 2.3317 / CBS 10644) TaxID=1160507 RepID=J8PI75_SACAR|nr:vps68p [Saccharomyces arboricola H-6]
MDADDHVSLFRFPFKIPTFRGIRKAGVYLSGALYALGFWIFLDAVLFSRYSNASDVHVTFIDWIPFLCSTLGTLIVNSIEKNRLLQGALSSDGGAFGSGGADLDSSMAWQARTILFFGFALLAGGLSGSIVVLIIKFLVKDYNTYPTLGMGINNVLGNVCILLSCVVLWIAQNVEDEYSYSLTL